MVLLSIIPCYITSMIEAMQKSMYGPVLAIHTISYIVNVKDVDQYYK